jgi:branched-chain amino acid aminotransferase
LVNFIGDFVPWADATIHVYCPAVKYGAGVFEGIRGYWSDADQHMHLFRVADHPRHGDRSAT